MTTALEATDKDFERMMQMLTGFFVTQIAGAVATYSICYRCTPWVGFGASEGIAAAADELRAAAIRRIRTGFISV
jgi:hypothetical protein